MVLERMVQATAVIHKQKGLGEKLEARYAEIQGLYEAKLAEVEAWKKKYSSVTF